MEFSTRSLPQVIFEVDMVEKESMYNLLMDFYKYGFVIIKNVPTESKYF